MPDPDEEHVARVRDVFDEWARHGRGDRMAASHHPFAMQILERLALVPTDWFLDVGCGTGYAVCWAARVVRHGRAVGIDVAEGMIARARELCAGLPNADFHVAHFPVHHTLPPARFTAAFSMETYYYFPDLEAALRETLRLLAPGGRFACAVDYYRENVASHGWPDDLGVPLHLLDAPAWREAFRAAGFTDIEQDRVRVPRDETDEAWKATEGSLLTIGTRP